MALLGNQGAWLGRDVAHARSDWLTSVADDACPVLAMPLSDVENGDRN